MFVFYHTYEAAGASSARLPRALTLEGKENFWQTSGAVRGEIAEPYVDVIARSESDEAIHLTTQRSMDCFASLAMTVDELFEIRILSRRPCESRDPYAAAYR